MNYIILAIIMKYSLIHNVDPRLVASIIQVESSFNKKAVGGLGELGLMQLRPEYYPEYTKDDLFSPDLNIELGVKHLKKAIDSCKHKEDLTSVVCYNVGVGGGNKIKYPKKWKYYKKVKLAYDEIGERAAAL